MIQPKSSLINIAFCLDAQYFDGSINKWELGIKKPI